jgi:hypothetical protein
MLTGGQKPEKEGIKLDFWCRREWGSGMLGLRPGINERRDSLVGDQPELGEGAMNP